MSGYEIALKELHRREKERIRMARKYFEKEFFQIIKDTMPDVDINKLKFKWSNSYQEKLSILQKYQLYRFRRQIKRDIRKAFKNE